jgi:putative oxidoreductase
MIDRSAPEGLEPHVRSVLRIVAGFLFFQHGLQKLFGMLGGLGGSGATAESFTLIWLAGILETFGGSLIMLGLFTRSVAFILCGMMAYAYFTAHAPRGFWPILNGGELAALYCFVYLYLSVAGPGPWSLDYLMGARKRKTRPAGARDIAY